MPFYASALALSEDNSGVSASSMNQDCYGSGQKLQGVLWSPPGSYVLHLEFAYDKHDRFNFRYDPNDPLGSFYPIKFI